MFVHIHDLNKLGSGTRESAHNGGKVRGGNAGALLEEEQVNFRLIEPTRPDDQSSRAPRSVCYGFTSGWLTRYHLVLWLARIPTASAHALVMVV